MRVTMKLAALAVMGAVAATSAVAHGGHGRWEGRGGVQPVAVGERLDALEAALKLQPAQAPAWAAFESTLLANAQERARLREAMPDRADREAMADFRVAMMKFNARAAEQANDARRALVATLSPEQRATFERFAHARGGPRHHHFGTPGHAPRDCPSWGGA